MAFIWSSNVIANPSLEPLRIRVKASALDTSNTVMPENLSELTRLGSTPRWHIVDSEHHGTSECVRAGDATACALGRTFPAHCRLRLATNEMGHSIKTTMQAIAAITQSIAPWNIERADSNFMCLVGSRTPHLILFNTTQTGIVAKKRIGI
jgi:hypothetical protein